MKNRRHIAVHIEKPLFLLLLVALFQLPLTAWTDPDIDEPSTEQLTTGRPFIYHIESDPRGGRAYKLVYRVTVPMETYWNFKTDFDNDFLRTNKYIESHRMVRRTDNGVITENSYSNVPDILFRWQTIIRPARHRLDFWLTNPTECNQKFHYGHILLEPMEKGTKVTHIAYFDFFGAAIWAHYPWAGGMTKFLNYTAQWEQDTILKLKERYGEQRK